MLLCCKNNPNLREKIKNQACNCCSRCSGMCPVSMLSGQDLQYANKSLTYTVASALAVTGAVFVRSYRGQCIRRTIMFHVNSPSPSSPAGSSPPAHALSLLEREREREREREKEVTMWEITETERFQREREYQWESTERKIFKMSVREGKCQWDNENVSERVIMSGR